MAPGLFEAPRNTITPPRRFDGEVQRMMADETLEHSLHGIVHPRKEMKGKLPDYLQVKRAPEPARENEDGEKEKPLPDLKVKI